MKKLPLKKILCSTSLITALTLNTMSSAFAHSINNADTQDFQIPSVRTQGPLARRSYSRQYTMSDLNQYNYTDLVNLLVTLQWNDITDLFKYNSGAQTFYSDVNRVQALIDAIEERGSQYTDKDSKGIPTLVEVLRAGFYLGFYNDSLKTLTYRSTKDKCLPAIIAIEKNPHFKLGTKVQDKIISSLGLLISNTSSNVEVVNRLTPILKQYNDNFDTYIIENSKGTAVYNLFQGVEYDISTYLRQSRKTASSSKWAGKIDGFIDEIGKMAVHGNLNSANAWLINNGIYYTGKLSELHSNPQKGNEVLTKATETYTYLGEQYLKAAEQITNNYKSVDFNGKSLNFDEIKEKAKEHFLPKKYTFDDGKIIVNTGDKVTEEKVKRVYWALKEVKSQFFRSIGSDTPVDPKQTCDDILKIKIYNSPAEYKLNSVLYGLSTDNGGMYIESTGTFFTYERTPQESIYSLEELCRHELTHHLQGRYLVPGLWSRGPLYKNNRLTWLEEGGAEFFAGSTRTGILPRKSIISNLTYTTPGQRYTVEKTVHSGYGSFEFYNYSEVLMDYLYNNYWSMFDSINDAIRKNDVTNFDTYMNSLSNNYSNNDNYQAHMNLLIKKYDKLTTPLVSDDYVKNHPYKKASEVYSTISSVSGISNVKTNVSKSQFFNTFTLKGKYTGNTTGGEQADWKKMNSLANEWLNKLDAQSWSGFKTVTCYFTNHRVNSNNQFEFDVTFTGILNDDNTTVTNVNQNPIANINVGDKLVENQSISFNSNGSNDSDGRIVSYLWNFGDQTTSSQENPKHIYKQSGNYEVNLTVTDDEGATNTVTKTITVKAAPTSTSTTKDKDKNKNKNKNTNTNTNTIKVTKTNNTFENADGPLKRNKVVSNTLTNDDTKDIFYFNVASSGKINIDLTKNSDAKLNWTVYSESNLNQYVAYATRGSNTKLSGSFDAAPGKYYVKVYKYAGDTGSYTLNVDGNIGEAATNNSSSNNTLSVETESNDTFKTANGSLPFNQNISGSMNGNDNKDIYFFDVASPGEIKIDVTEHNKNSINWMLYHESDTRNYVTYAQPRDNKLVNSFNAKAGRYYLKIYKYSRSDASYTINLKK